MSASPRLPLLAALLGLGVAFCFDTSAAVNEAAGTLRRVIHLCDCAPSDAVRERSALLASFAEHGFVQGSNLDLVTRDTAQLDEQELAGILQRKKPGASPTSEGNVYSRFLVREMRGTLPDLVLASGVRAVEGVRQSGMQVPVVFWRVSDPVGFGFVQSLARPGGNLTGFSRATEALTLKRFELLTEMLPSARRIAVLSVEGDRHDQTQVEELDRAAEVRGVTVEKVSLRLLFWSPTSLEQTFSQMKTAGIEAFLLPDLSVQRDVVVSLAAKYRLPTIYASAAAITESGGLAAYTTATQELAGVAEYAIRILKGESPANLPVQEPTRYELIVNTRAARGIGLSFPPAFMLQVTSVVDR